VFIFCNYRIVLTKISHMILRLFDLFCCLWGLFCCLCGFCRDIRTVSDYFVVYEAYFGCF
jgi:hypothetical protein